MRGVFVDVLDIYMLRELTDKWKFCLFLLHHIHDADDGEYDKREDDERYDHPEAVDHHANDPQCELYDDEYDTLFYMEFHEWIILRHEERNDDKNTDVREYAHEGAIVRRCRCRGLRWWRWCAAHILILFWFHRNCLCGNE